MLLGVFGTKAQEFSGLKLLTDSTNVASFYKMRNNASFIEFFLKGKKQFGDHAYYQEVRTYSWGSSDTNYYREDDEYYYHFDPDNGLESIVLPKHPLVGQMWLEADSSWSYEILAIDRTLKVPRKKYKNLVLVECKQLTGRDKSKYDIYHLYYGEGQGFVASMSKASLSSYLEKRVFRAKEGDVIGD